MRFVKYTGTVVQIDDYGRNFSTGTYYLLNCTDCKFSEMGINWNY